MTVPHVETNPADFDDYAALHGLLSTSFAYMAGRIDPPSSMTALTQDGLRRKAGDEDLFLVRDGGRPVACLFGAATPDGYYIGKLAVAAAQRRRGLARALVEAAAARARALGLPALELQTRVELTENHAAFAAMGFVQTAATAHPGYDRPTSLTFRRPL
ncbi:GNAT family N-acetyltransferase [Roseicyclus persicicus]|uniref:GNAT family N-acetyltransferase n=1 Tax=Roseicyclus persicicus TaxID=2650661 RepID=A0A7X6H2A7_9RHOB|nr:GNAT family N-acetyltransferase [Roseibacterium persicicum]NKX46054.1 GNAT family N-acetyltransferase [Roseibacterium persicicum]